MNASGRLDAAATGSSQWRLSSLVHLVYLLILVFQPAFDPASTRLDWLLVAAIVAVFVPIYVHAWIHPERARWWGTVPTTLLGIAATPFNAGAAVLFIYAAAAAGSSESRRDALRWFVGLTVLVSVLAAVSPVPMPWRLWAFVPPLLFIWVIGLTQIEEAEREREAAELRMRNLRVEHLATVAERERIARDLHDLLGHSLTSVVVRAQLAKQLAEVDPARAGEEAAEIERIARDALAQVRTAVRGWRQGTLKGELEAARATLATVGVELLVHRDEELAIVGSTEHELALALREAVTNVARHARAGTCRVDIAARDGELLLVVADDGVGGSAPEGSGLAGIRERIAALGGRVQRSGTAGTTITVAVPLRVAT